MFCFVRFTEHAANNATLTELHSHNASQPQKQNTGVSSSFHPGASNTPTPIPPELKSPIGIPSSPGFGARPPGSFALPGIHTVAAAAAR